MADTRTEPQLYREPELEAEPPPLKTKPSATAATPSIDRVKQGAQATSEPDAKLVRPTKPARPTHPSKSVVAAGDNAGAAKAADVATDPAVNSAVNSISDEVLKRRLLNRIAIAAVLVVGLLGSLAMFDALYRPAVKSPPPMAVLTPKEDATPAPQPIGKEAAPSIQPTSSAATTTQTVPTSTSAAAPALPAPPPAVAKLPTSVPKAPSEVAPKAIAAAPHAAILPLAGEKPLTRPATARPTIAYPTEPLPPLASPQARPDATRDVPKTPALAVPPPAKAATIAPPVVTFAPPTPFPAPRPAIQGEGRFFALQMGVFSNMTNAEDMRAKLELHGIPTTVETRIHVGPFKTRAEADAARVKLRELGLDGGLLITMRK